MAIEAIGSISGACLSFGNVGSAVGSVASAVGRGASSVGRISVEASVPAAALSGVGKLSGFGLKLEGPLTTIVNEGPVNLADLKNAVPLQIGSQPVEALDAQAAVAEVEVFLAQARVEPKQEPANPLNKVEVVQPAWELVLPQVEPMVAPWALSGVQRAVEAQPKLQPATKIATETRITNQPAQAVTPAVSPALEKQEAEELIEEKIIKNETSAEKEEKIEISELKDVIDEKVLETRIAEFGSAAEIVAAAADNNLEEINGKEIVEQVQVETEEKRSGLVKKSGPDGSREETIEEVGSRKFKSIKEAREVIAAIIFNKPPVKKEKEGQEVGQEAVARVLKYRRENTLEDLGLAEVFPKAA